MASLGKGGPVDSRFEPSADVPKAGVLLALPALLASGLWIQRNTFAFRPDITGVCERPPEGSSRSCEEPIHKTLFLIRRVLLGQAVRA